MARAPVQVLVLPYRRRTRLEVAVFRRADYDLWQFVSGGVEHGESTLDAARREAREEAGVGSEAVWTALDTRASVPACWFPAWPTWPADVLVVPEHCFAVRVETPLQLSEEHVEVAWLEVQAALDRLHFDSNKTALWELRERLDPGPRRKRFAYR